MSLSSIKESQRKFHRNIIAGLVGTTLMTFVIILIAPLLGCISRLHLFLSHLLDCSLFIGWFVYFSLGIMFAFTYAILLMPILKRLSNCYVRGFIFGIFLSIMSGLIYYYLGLLNNVTWGLSVLLFLSHVVYGLGVARIVVD